MTVGGILETALHVADPARSAGFYRRLFGFGTLLESERPRSPSTWQAATSCCCSRRGRVRAARPARRRDPAARRFGAAAPGLLDRRRRRGGVAGASRSRGRRRRELRCSWPGGATSLYFRDPDGHLRRTDHARPLGDLLSPRSGRQSPAVRPRPAASTEYVGSASSQVTSPDGP